MSKEDPEVVRDDAYWEGMSRAVEAGEYEVVGPAEYGPGHHRRTTRGVEIDFSPTRAVRLSPEMDAALSNQAAKENVTVGDLMKDAVSEYLNKHT